MESINVVNQFGIIGYSNTIEWIYIQEMEDK